MGEASLQARAGGNPLLPAHFSIGAKMKPDYQRGGITLFNADCRDVLPSLLDWGIQAVVTDPPFGVEGGHGGQTKDYRKADYAGEWEDNPEYIKTVCAPAIAFCVEHFPCVALTPGARCCFAYPPPDDMGCFWVPSAARRGRWGFQVFNPILYYGRDFRAGRGCLPSGIQTTEIAPKVDHPCPKPIEAWTWLVHKMCPPEGLVLDPFLGSGTTALSAINTGRRCVGIEISPKYFDLCAKRADAALDQGRLDFSASGDGARA